jgi:vacuolar-type H+-ATPase subunit H
MTLYGVIAAAIVRKVKALVAEYRKLVSEATAVEKKIVGDAKAEAQRVLAAAEAETGKLRNELIDKIAAL